MLRLVSSTIGPVSIAVGSNGSTRTVEAYNAGTGTLSLTVTSSVTWLTATVGSSASCSTTSLASTCVPISVAFNTSSLSSGQQTGTLTVSGASGTLDAPQTITVTVNMGGAVPSSITVYVPPSGSVDYYTPTNSDLKWKATTTDGNSWLSMTINGTGSFKYDYPWYVHFEPQTANTVGSYTGTMTLSGSSFSSDNKSIAVTMNVTNSPIASGPSSVNLRMAQGAPPYAIYSPVSVTLSNLGNGTLSISKVTPTISSCGSSWLTVTQTTSGASLAVDPTGLSIGTCSATLAFTTNAANTLDPIPVTLNVVAKGSPSINYQGVLDNGTYVAGDTVAQGDVMIVKGEQLTFSGSSTGGYTGASSLPLPTTLGGASVLVNGVNAPLYYTMYNQLAFQMPVDTTVGTATVQVTRDDGTTSNLASVTVAAKAPRILMLGATSVPVIVNATDATFPVSSAPSAYPTLSVRAAKVGETLVIYAIGLGATTPAVSTGAAAPSSPLAYVASQPSVAFRTSNAVVTPVMATPSFAGLTPGYAGLYQVNVTIPSGSPTGTVYLFLSFADGTVSNTVQIAVQ